MAYLLKCERKETNFYEQRSLRIAQVTIYRAYFKRDPNAFQNAERQLMEAWETQEEKLAKYAPHFLPAFRGSKPSTIPLAAPAETVSFVDGRDGRQWTASIHAYLSWRAGDRWRPQRDRWHPDKTYYLDASRLLNELDSGDPSRLEKYKPAPAPAFTPEELPPKKPAASAAHQLLLPLPGLAIQQQLPIAL
jgi:hypothetical protein